MKIFYNGHWVRRICDVGDIIFTYYIDCRKRFIILFLFLFFFFIALGYWQLERADEKKMMLTTYELAMKKASHPLASFSQHPPLPFEKVSVQGHYLPFYFLLDNQQQNGHLGYDVISAFLMTNDVIIFIDRGFLLAPLTRQNLPNVGFLPQTALSVEGMVYYPKKGLMLGRLVDKQTQTCMVIEAIDVSFMGSILHKSALPFIMRLEKNEPYGFLREWPLVSMPPKRHIGYAIQWFSMAIALFCIFIGLCVKKRK